MPSRYQCRSFATIYDRIYAMDDNNLVAREYDLSLETSLLIRGWIQDNTEGKNVPIFSLEKTLEQIIIELKLMREEMLKRGLEKRLCHLYETDKITGNSTQ